MRNGNKPLATAASVLLVILLTVTVSYGLGALEQVPEANPVDGLAPGHSRVLPAGEAEDGHALVDYLAEAYGDADTGGDSPEAGDAEGKGQGAELTEADPPEAGPDAQARSEDTERVSQQGDQDGSDPPYFTTNLVDGQTVTRPELGIQITHLNPELTVESVRIYLGDTQVRNFDGQVVLNEGINTIDIQVSYRDADSQRVSAAGTYTVTYVWGEIVLTTDLENGLELAAGSVLRFAAAAELDGSAVPVSVTVNGQTLAGDDGSYGAVIAAGTNTISLSAARDGKRVQATYTVTGTEAGALYIETDLTNRGVNRPSLDFTARAVYSAGGAVLTVSVNGQVLTGDGDNYTARLERGSNTIELVAEGGGMQVSESYTVTYSDMVSGNGEEADNRPPTIETNIVNGATVNNRTYNFQVRAWDYQDNPLAGRHITIDHNAESCKMLWSNEGQVSYQIRLVPGSNSILVEVVDDEGNWDNVTYTVYYAAENDDGIIGTATISVEATTVGLGYIIPETQVTLYADEPASVVLDRLLRENGLDYAFSGRLDSSFYLSYISGENLVVDPSIPEDLAPYLQQHATWFDPDAYSPDSLGEFDFTNGSGWLYQVNGIYPNYGFADYYFQDGDVMRIRFSTFYGYDIGGGYIMGGTHESWPKEW